MMSQTNSAISGHQQQPELQSAAASLQQRSYQTKQQFTSNTQLASTNLGYDLGGPSHQRQQFSYSSDGQHLSYFS